MPRREYIGNMNDHAGKAPRISLLIVEDEDAIREGLVDVFVYHGYDVTAVADGREGLERALTGAHHLIVLDLMLPSVDGMTICDEVRRRDRAQPIVMLTARGDEDDVIRGLRSGADDYVTKPFSVRELVARVEAVLRRSHKLAADASKVTHGALTVDPRALTADVAGRMVELTRRECDLLRYLIGAADRPVSRRELLHEVWGYRDAEFDTRTVDIHVAKLRRKLEDDPESPRLIVTVRGAGYRIGP